jgi:hypothetical protein
MSGNVPAPTEKDTYRIVRAVRELFEGRSNAVGEFTLAVSPATTTMVTAQNCGAGSKVMLCPKSASAAAGLASTYIATVNNGSFVVTHASSAASDRTFLYAALG